ncbi:MAG TPA: aquaporin [Thermoanaerobaculia bacterium]|nr:aquaporin [Thermoanaerobaculia bacterium]
MSRVVVAEGVGTALLLAAVVGSGIMAERLSGGNDALALLANSFATAAALIALISAFAPVSGAHFNPVVTIASIVERGTATRELLPRLAAQFTGAIAGVIAAHWMFGLQTLTLSTRERGGAAQMWSEVVATFGLVGVIHATGKRPHVVPMVVAAYIAAAYWFTASTSFANPAVTLARAFTNTFTGIRLADVGPFIAAQLAGGIGATFLFRWLYAEVP